MDSCGQPKLVGNHSDINDSEMTDGQLVEAISAGDRTAFAALVARYWTSLIRVAISRLGHQQLAEDAVQETFLNVHRWLHTYDSRYSLRTWLWTILLNQCKRSAKSKMRQPGSWTDQGLGSEALGPASEHDQDQTSQPEQAAMAEEERQQVDRLLNDLDSPLADALRLRFFGGLKFREIADAMQCSLSTAKNRVKWGLTALSEQLRQQEAPFNPTLNAGDDCQ